MTLPDVLVGVCHTGLLIKSDRSVRPKTLPLKSLHPFAVGGAKPHMQQGQQQALYKSQVQTLK